MKEDNEKEIGLINRYFKINPSKLTKNLKEAIDFSKKFKFPFILKIISNNDYFRIAKNIQELNQYYNELLSLAKKSKLKPEILIEEHISGEEFIIKGKKDKTFGNIISIGKKDNLNNFSTRISPLTEKDIDELIKESKIHEKIKNDKHLKSLLLKINNIILKHPEILEIEINPLILNDKGVFIVDAKILIN
jgi:succinyl-CoA synthetase beta subunit